METVPIIDELLGLFIKYAQGLETVRLRSDLEQLKDTSSPEVEPYLWLAFQQRFYMPL